MMGRYIETFTNCAGPNTARPHQKLGGIAGFLANAWLNHPILTVLGVLAYFGFTSVTGPVGPIALALAIIAGAKKFKSWYYTERLLCIREDECAVGSVISPPKPPARDGDIKLNLRLAPFTQGECERTLVEHLAQNNSMLSDQNDDIYDDWIYHEETGLGSFISRTQPAVYPWTINNIVTADGFNREVLREYVSELKGRDDRDTDYVSNAYNQIALGVVHRLLLDTNANSNPHIIDPNTGQPLLEAKNYQGYLYRKDRNVITDTPTWQAIPVDYPGPEGTPFDWLAPNAKSGLRFPNPQTGEEQEHLNPMFRMGHYDKEAEATEEMVPYLHCEIEGNWIEVFCNRLIDALWVFIVAAALTWWLPWPLNVAASAAAAFIAYALKWLWDKITGNDGDAAAPDIDWSDPDAEGQDGYVSHDGDVVALYGRWIMDTEHHQYFEIHPVRAYYIMRHRVHTEEDIDYYQDWVGVADHSEVDPLLEKYPIENITATVRRQMCQMIAGEEGDDWEPPTTVDTTTSNALSYGLAVMY
jgi:hypothetical protein